MICIKYIWVPKYTLTTMGLTAPQSRTIFEDKRALFKRFTRMIDAAPGSLMQIVDDARGSGKLPDSALVELLAYAQRKGYMSLQAYQQYARRFDKAKTGRIRRTGKIKPEDSALLPDSDENLENVTCVMCGDSTNSAKADVISGLGWMCNICSGN
jgi:hypothetical protein